MAEDFSINPDEFPPFRRFRPERGIFVYRQGELSGIWRRFAPLFDSAWDMDAVKIQKSRKAVVKFQTGGKNYYVKIYSRRHAPGIEHNLLRGSSLAFLRSKALIHLRKAQSLSAIGLSVVQPCMVIQRRYGFLRQESMLITPESTLPTLAECLRQENGWESYLPAIENMIRDIAKIHRAGYIQRDPHFGNVFVGNNSGIKWLDFGTIKRFWLNKKKTYRDLRMLHAENVQILKGRVTDPDEFAYGMLKRNYPDTGRLQKAIGCRLADREPVKRAV